MQRSLIRITTLLVLIGLLLTACGAPQAQEDQLSTPSESQTTPDEQDAAPEQVSQDSADGSPETETAAEPQPTGTPDNRMPPEQWQDWPVVPEVTVTAINTYQRGLALGNDPRAFSKVGDCQSISEVMLGIYDIPGRYTLRDEDAYLQETIDQFRGSFNRDGYAVKGGFNAAAVLSPLWADPAVCLPGESPLECELRVHKPGIMIISLEVWWEGRTVERYETYMRQIIETALEAGVVPILSTKADNVEGDYSINYTTAKLAYEYDIPLWNFWLAVQPLDFRGLDPERDDFHITEEAWNVRSYTALQTLDTIYRGVQASSALASTVSETAESGGQPTQQGPLITEGVKKTETPDTTVLPQVSGSFVFGLATRSAGDYQYQGVYKFDFAALELSKLMDAGYNLQAVSPDGSKLLVNMGSDLYVVESDGSNPVLLANGFYALGRQGAYWMPDGSHIALIAELEGENQVRLLPLDGSSWTILSSKGKNPIELYPSSNPDNVFWAEGSCVSYNDCSRISVWSSPVAGGMDENLLDVSDPVFSPDGSRFAYIDKYGEEKINLAVSNLDRSADRAVPILGSGENEYVLMDLTWSPQSDRIHVLILERSDYSGKWLDIRDFIINMSNLGNQEFTSLSGQNARTLWSPAGGTILMTSTESSDDSYYLAVRLLDIGSKKIIDFSDLVALTSDDYMLTTTVFWLPQ